MILHNKSLLHTGPPTGTIIPGIPSTGSGSSNSITLGLSYGNANSDDEIITGISLSWREINGNNMGSVTLDANRTSFIRYTIMGLTPITNYKITMFAINQCGNGEEFSTDIQTEDPANTTPSGATSGAPTTNTTTTEATNKSSTNNPTEGPSQNGSDPQPSE